MANFDKYGQIIRGSIPQNNPPHVPQNNPVRPPLQQNRFTDPIARKTFVKATMIISPLLYGIIGSIIGVTSSDPGTGLAGGVVLGLVGTGIYNLKYGQDADGEPKDYLYSLGAPLALMVGIGLIGVVIAFFLIGAMLGGG